jgi:glycosyltransferase involved in cell wall biosynthesis
MTEPRTVLFGPLPPPYGGVAVFMRYIGDACLKRGIEVWSYTGERYPGGEAVRFLNHRRLGHIRRLLGIEAGSRLTDSTHFHLEYPHWLLLPLWLAARKLKKFTWVKIVHDGSLPSRFEHFGSIRKRLFIFGLRSVDEIVVFSRELEDWFRAKAASGTLITLLPFPTPLAGDREPLDGGFTAALAQFRRHEKRVVSIGVFIPSYGFLHVANALEKLRRETGNDIGLLLIDAEFAGDEEYRSSVVDGRDWIIVAESVPNRQMPHIFDASDVFVRAFEHESFGLSRVEALLCGLPVIATCVGEIRGMFTYRFDDTEQLERHLRGLLTGRYKIDTGKWAALFRSEAEASREAILRVITGDN